MVLNKGGYQLIDCGGYNADEGFELFLERDVFHAVLDSVKPVYFVNFRTYGSDNGAVIKDKFEYTTGSDTFEEYEGTAGGGIFTLVGHVDLDAETGEECGWRIIITKIE